MDDIPEWEGCERCKRSFDTVWYANLTFFQTIIAGDSWGLVALPVIERHALAGLLFTFVHFTVVFGMLNLIVAVLVDAAAAGRAGDIQSRARERDAEEIRERRNLERIFQMVDADDSGEMSFNELCEGVQMVPELREQLRVLDVSSKDLYCLFEILDKDGSGEIDSREFIDAIYRMKCTEAKTATTFVKHHVESIKQTQEMLVKQLCELTSELTHNGRTQTRLEEHMDLQMTGSQALGSQALGSQALGSQAPDPTFRRLRSRRGGMTNSIFVPGVLSASLDGTDWGIPGESPPISPANLPEPASPEVLPATSISTWIRGVSNGTNWIFGKSPTTSPEMTPRRELDSVLPETSISARRIPEIPADMFFAANVSQTRARSEVMRRTSENFVGLRPLSAGAAALVIQLQQNEEEHAAATRSRSPQKGKKADQTLTSGGATEKVGEEVPAAPDRRESCRSSETPPRSASCSFSDEAQQRLPEGGTDSPVDGGVILAF